MHRQLRAMFGDVLDRVDVAEVELRIDPLGEHVERHGDDVDVAGALAIAEQGALDPLGARHQRQLRRRDRGAAVVVRMNGQDHARAVGDVTPEPLELVRVGIGRRHLDGRRKVENEPPRGRGPDDVLDRLANLERDLELGPGEAFRRIFELKVSAPRGVCERSDLLGRIDRDFLDTLRVGAEDDFALQGGRRIVEVDDDLLRAFHRLEGALDQFRAALGQDLDRDIVRNCAALDDRADEVEISLRGGGKGDLDLLEPHANQKLEHAVLALDAHRLDQRLIAVAKVDRAPDRRLVDDARGPLAVGQDDGRVGAVFLNGHLCHDEPWGDLRRLRLQTSRPTLPVD